LAAFIQNKPVPLIKSVVTLSSSGKPQKYAVFLKAFANLSFLYLIFCKATLALTFSTYKLLSAPKSQL
jgi:hypothetical protein